MADLATYIAGASTAAAAIASAIVSVGKSGSIARDLIDERAARGLLADELRKAIASVSAALALLQADLTRLSNRLDRRQAQHNTGSFPSIETLANVQRAVEEIGHRVHALEQRADACEKRDDKQDGELDALAAEFRKAWQDMLISITKIATRIDERLSRRYDRGSSNG